MLRNTFQPKTSALQNLEAMFEEFPVITTESLKLKMDVFNRLEEPERADERGLSSQQALFSRVLTSINPFAQFLVQEMVEASEGRAAKHWVLDEKILQRPGGTPVLQEHLLKTSAEMFSIYTYTKDPLMQIKSAKYTGDKFVAIKDLVVLADSLLVSSPLTNSLMLLDQHNRVLNAAAPPSEQ